MLEDMAGYLVAEGLGTLGTDLFLGQMPDSPDACTVLYQYPGRPPAFTHGDPQPETRYPRVQVLCRELSQPLAMSRATSVYTALCALVNAQHGDSTFLRVAPMQEPFPLQIDASQRVIVACNYEATL
jgi:hypothetical protein